MGRIAAVTCTSCGAGATPPPWPWNVRLVGAIEYASVPPEPEPEHDAVVASAATTVTKRAAERVRARVHRYMAIFALLDRFFGSSIGAGRSSLQLWGAHKCATARHPRTAPCRDLRTDLTSRRDSGADASRVATRTRLAHQRSRTTWLPGFRTRAWSRSRAGSHAFASERPDDVASIIRSHLA